MNLKSQIQSRNANTTYSRSASSSAFSDAIDEDDDKLIVSILGPPNAGKSTLFNRLMCKESNRTYRLASDKNRRRPQRSKVSPCALFVIQLLRSAH